MITTANGPRDLRGVKGLREGKEIEETGPIENELRELKGLIGMTEARETKGLIEVIEVIEAKEADMKEGIEAEIEEAIETSAGDRNAQLKKKIHTSMREERSKESARPTPKKPSSSKASSRSA